MATVTFSDQIDGDLKFTNITISESGTGDGMVDDYDRDGDGDYDATDLAMGASAFGVSSSGYGLSWTAFSASAYFSAIETINIDYDVESINISFTVSAIHENYYNGAVLFGNASIQLVESVYSLGANGVWDNFAPGNDDVLVAQSVLGQNGVGGTNDFDDQSGGTELGDDLVIGSFSKVHVHTTLTLNGGGNGGVSLSGLDQTFDTTFNQQQKNPCIDIEKFVHAEYYEQNNTGGEGLTPGFWKTHSEYGPAPFKGWPEVEAVRPDVFPDASYETIFGVGLSGSALTTFLNNVPGTPSLLDALNDNGGDVHALLRHSTAALCNSLDPYVSYLYTPAQVIQMTHDAIIGVGPYTVEQLKDIFASQNELGADLSTPASAGSTLIITPDVDADTSGSGPFIPVGGKAVFTYYVTNCGNVALSDIQVTDDRVGVTAVKVLYNGSYYNVGDVNHDNMLDLTEKWKYTASETVIPCDGSDPNSGLHATFNMTGSSSTTGTAGNIRTFTNNGISVNASAFSRDTSGVWSTAYLGAYGGGLGVTNGGEDGSSPNHAVDNVGRVDYVLFEFDHIVTVDKAALGWVSGDSDLTYWIGTFGDPYDSHLTLSDALLGSMGGPTEDATTLTGARTADINPSGTTGNVLVISASVFDTTPDDYFKIQQLIIDSCTTCEFVNTGTVTGKYGTVAVTDSDKAYYSTSEFCQTLGDFVWSDTDCDGIQDAGELGIAGINVQLLASDGVTVLQTTTTDANGNYLFNVGVGDYIVKVAPPSGYHVSPQNVGANDAKDSDISTSTYKTAVIHIAQNEQDLSNDIGLCVDTPIGKVGDFVWCDVDCDGVQDAGEGGVNGVTVKLYTSANALVATTTTASGGKYLFDNVGAGDYYVKFVLPADYHFSPKDAGGDDAKDSDASTSTGQTATFHLNAGQSNLTLDAGLCKEFPPDIFDGTPGYWYNHKEQWNGTTSDDQAGKPDVIPKPLVDLNKDGTINSKDIGVLIGDTNENGKTDAGETTLFIPLAAAQKLISSSETANDTRQILAKHAIAAQLNIDNGHNAPNDLTGEAAKWLRGLAPYQYASSTGKIDTNGNGVLDSNEYKIQNGIFSFTSTVLTSDKPAWQTDVDVFDGAGTVMADGEDLKNALSDFNSHILVVSTDGSQVGIWNGSVVNFAHSNTADQFWLSLHDAGLI